MHNTQQRLKHTQKLRSPRHTVETKAHQKLKSTQHTAELEHTKSQKNKKKITIPPLTL